VKRWSLNVKHHLREGESRQIPEIGKTEAAEVDPQLRPSNDHFLKWRFREQGDQPAALSLMRDKEQQRHLILTTFT